MWGFVSTIQQKTIPYVGVCTNGDMRLAAGTSDYVGRVELCYDGHWGTVCDNGISDSAAEVVCRHLGLPTYGEYQ